MVLGMLASRLLCLFLFVPNLHAFVPTRRYQSTRFTSFVIKSLQNPDDLKENLNRAKDEVPNKQNKLSEDAKRDKDEVPKRPNKLSEDAKNEDKKLQRGTLVSMIFIGLGLGGYADTQLTDVNPFVLPLLLAASLTGGMYYAYTDERAAPFTEFANDLLGRPAVDFAYSTKDNVLGYVDNQKAALEKKKSDTIDYVQNIPANTKAAARDYVESVKSDIRERIDNIVTKIKQLPEDTKAGLIETGEDIKADVDAKLKATVDDIKQIPVRLQATATTKLEETRDKLIALPGELADQGQQKVDQVIDNTRKSVENKVSSIKSTIESVIPASSSPVGGTTSNSISPAVPPKQQVAVDSKPRSAPTPAPSKPSPSTANETAPPAKKPEPVVVEKKKAASGPSIPNPLAGLTKAKEAAPPAKKPEPVVVEKKKLTTGFTKKVAPPKDMAPEPVVAGKNQKKPVSKAPGDADNVYTPVNLSPSAVKSIKSVQGKKVNAVEEIDNLLGVLIDGKTNPEGFYKTVSSVLSKDDAFVVLPDLIGSLPRGNVKSALNSFYQQKA